MKKTAAFLMWAFAIAGFILSAYLVFHHYQIRYTEGYKSVCNINEQLNCDAVALHTSSEFLWVPVAVWGLFFYGTIMYLLFLNAYIKEPATRTRINHFFICILLTGFLVDLYFLWVSLGVIHSICIFCVSTYFANAFMLLIGLDLGAQWKRIPRSIKYVLQDFGWGS